MLQKSEASVVGGHRKIDKPEWSYPHTKREKGVNALFAWASLCLAPLKCVCRKRIEPKMDDIKRVVRPSRSSTDQIFYLPRFFWVIAAACQKHLHFVDLDKAYARVAREMLIGMLRECAVDGHMLLATKSLYSCSEASVRFGGVKRQPFTVGVGLQQGCVLSVSRTLLHSPSICIG